MVNEKSSGKLFFLALIIAVLLFGLIKIIYSAGGNFLRLELLGLVFLTVLSFIGFIGYTKHYGEKFFFLVSIFYIINLILIWLLIGPLYFILLLAALICFLVSIPRKSEKNRFKNRPNENYGSLKPHEMKYDLNNEPASEIFEEPVKTKTEEKNNLVEAKSIKSKSEPKVEKKSATKFSPAKYVASKRSNVYHEPKCEWAKKIKKDKRIWFQNKEEAWEKGYKKHSCVE
ncbi:MAG: hypothetical protein ABH824_07805 [Nanoarchaeota archaeon]|nr:hypothetical protein [Nanoarchaeota archaeon]MBU1631614.1 hypothetical protein [Nanoarchaeota archaeon]MBU1876633.1 hypothetical protein [Nanoarchaeota archaeon]